MQRNTTTATDLYSLFFAVDRLGNLRQSGLFRSLQTVLNQLAAASDTTRARLSREDAKVLVKDLASLLFQQLPDCGGASPIDDLIVDLQAEQLAHMAERLSKARKAKPTDKSDKAAA